MSERVGGDGQGLRKFNFLDEYRDVYAGGVRIFSQTMLPPVFRTEEYNQAVWNGGLADNAPESAASDPSYTARSKATLEAQIFMRNAGTVAIIGQEAIENMRAIVPDSRVVFAAGVRRAAVNRLRNFIAAGEEIYILEAEADHGPIHPSYFSLGEGADGHVRGVVGAGPCDILFEPGSLVQDLEASFNIAWDRAWDTEQSAAYLKEVAARFAQEAQELPPQGMPPM